MPVRKTVPSSLLYLSSSLSVKTALFHLSIQWMCDYTEVPEPGQANREALQTLSRFAPRKVISLYFLNRPITRYHEGG